MPSLIRLALHLVGVARLISGYLHRRESVVHTADSASTADSIGHADASHLPNTLPTASGTEDGPMGSLSLPPAQGRHILTPTKVLMSIHHTPPGLAQPFLSHLSPALRPMVAPRVENEVSPMRCDTSSRFFIRLLGSTSTGTLNLHLFD